MWSEKSAEAIIAPDHRSEGLNEKENLKLC